MGQAQCHGIFRYQCLHCDRPTAGCGDTRSAPIASAVKPDNIHNILEEATATTETLPGLWLYLRQVCAAEAWSSLACEVVDTGCKFGQPWVLSFLLATRQPFYIVLLFLLGLNNTIVVSQELFQLNLAGAKYQAGPQLDASITSRLSISCAHCVGKTIKAMLQTVEHLSQQLVSNYHCPTLIATFDKHR